MKKVLAFLIMMLFCSGLLMAQKTKNQKKAKHNKEEVELPPPPMEELRVGEIDSSSVPVGVRNEGFTKEDFFFNSIDSTPPANDSLTAGIREYLDVTGAINLGGQFAKAIYKGGEDDVLPPEFYNRLIEEFTTGESKKYFEYYLIKIYRKHFTLDIIKELIKFYSSDAGKKTLALMPVIIAESQEMGAGFGRMVGMKVYNELLKEGKIK